MLLHLIRKEALDHLLSLRFAIACILCAGVFGLSSLVLSREYREADSTYHMNLVAHRNQIQQQAGRYSFWQGITVDRPLNVMNVLVRGLSPELTESIKVQGGANLEFPKAYEQNPIIGLFPAVDFAFIVGVIMSLLAVAFSYDAVAGERESGVLRLMMSYSVPRDQVLLGKWIGGYLALIAPFLLAFLAGLVVAVLFPEVAPDLDSTLSILGLLALALLYLGAFFSLGILVSCRVGSASTAITVLLLVWAASVLALPNIAPYLTRQVWPAPSRESVAREKQQLQQELGRQFQEMMRQEQQRTGRQDVWTDEGFRARSDSLRNEMQARLAKVDESYLARIQAQTRLAGIAARISPLASFHLGAFEMAAAGIEQERRFVEGLKTYSQTWMQYAQKKAEPMQRYFEEKRRQSKDGSISVTQEEMRQFENPDLSDYPVFRFAYMGFVDRLGQAWVDLLLLGLWNVVLFMLAYLSFLRRDVC